MILKASELFEPSTDGVRVGGDGGGLGPIDVESWTGGGLGPCDASSGLKPLLRGGGSNHPPGVDSGSVLLTLFWRGTGFTETSTRSEAKILGDLDKH